MACFSSAATVTPRGKDRAGALELRAGVVIDRHNRARTYIQQSPIGCRLFVAGIAPHYPHTDAPRFTRTILDYAGNRR